MIKLLILAAFILGAAYLFFKYYGLQHYLDQQFKVTTVSGNVANIIANITGGGSSIQVGYEIDITNKSDVTLTFSDLLIKLYYQGYPIGATPETADNLKQTSILPLDAKTGLPTTVKLTGTINVLINGTTINLATALQSGKPVQIDYKISVKVTSLNIPVPTISGNYIYQK